MLVYLPEIYGALANVHPAETARRRHVSRVILRLVSLMPKAYFTVRYDLLYSISIGKIYANYSCFGMTIIYANNLDISPAFYGMNIISIIYI